MPCTNSCGLDQGCNNPYLFYDGPENPSILVVGEAPGREEDERCRLFIGRSGIFLRNGLEQLGFDVDNEVGFCNVCSCRTPDNRTPTKTEMKTCRSNLVNTIKSVASSVKMVLLMGNTPLQAIFGTAGITKLHGITEYVGGVPYIPLFHPAYVLRNEGTSVVDVFIADLEKVGRVYEEISGTREKTWDYKVLDAEGLEKLIPEIEKSDLLAFDTETNTLDMYSENADMICVSFAFNKDKGYVIFLSHPDLVISPEELMNRIEALKKLFDSSIPKAAQNGMFDIRFLDRVHGIKVRNLKHDTTLMAHLVDENSQRDLTSLTTRYNPDMAGYDDVMAGEMKKANNQMVKIPSDLIKQYASGDALTTWRIAKRLYKIMTDENLVDLYNDIVIPALNEYIKIADAGVKIDEDKSTWLKEEYEKRLEFLENNIYTLPLCQEWEKIKGKKVNFASPKQVVELIYDMGKAPIQVHKKTGNPSLDADARQALISMPTNSKYTKALDVVKGMADIAKVRTLYKMFASKAESWIRDDGLVHPEFLLHGTVTGRLAMRSPNLQQAPREIPDDEWLKEHSIKTMFISKYPNGYLVSVDYSQLELRLMACMSGDSLMLETYRNNGDIHVTTARRMFPDYDKVEPDVRKKYRSDGKTMNFKSIYSLDETYLKIYPGVASYAKQTLDECKRLGYVTNVLGRRRRLPAIKSFNRTEFYHAYLQACNFKIQSLGHELIKIAVVKISIRLKKEGLHGHLILDVHDALVVDAESEEEAIKIAKIMKEEMESVGDFDWAVIPIIAEASIGRDWQSMKEVEDETK